MSLALLIQMNGLGLVLWWATYSSMAATQFPHAGEHAPAQPTDRDVAEDSPAFALVYDSYCHFMPSMAFWDGTGGHLWKA